MKVVSHSSVDSLEIPRVVTLSHNLGRVRILDCQLLCGWIYTCVTDVNRCWEGCSKARMGENDNCQTILPQIELTMRCTDLFLWDEFLETQCIIWVKKGAGITVVQGIWKDEGRQKPSMGDSLCLAPIAQGGISMSVAFPTHVWKMANICTHIIVWLFSHMCAFSHTYVSKSKHVWKIAPRCKYTNVFGFFQTCWVKVKH